MTRPSSFAAAAACLFSFCLPFAGAAHAVELPNDIGPNLALGKSYVSSDNNRSGWGPGLTDGDWTAVKLKTYASGNAKNFPKTVTIDLGKTETVAHAHVGVPNFGSTKTIEISLSMDGRAFAPAGTHDFGMEKDNSHLYAFAPAKARYVRLTFAGNYERTSTATRVYPATYCFVTEAEVYGPRGSGPTAGGKLPASAATPAAAGNERWLRYQEDLAREQAAAITDKLPASLGPNLALGKPFTCSDPNDDQFWNSGLNDGYWLMRRNHTFATGPGDAFPKIVTIDLKASAKLTHVRLGVPDFGSTKSVTVSVSYDGKTFTDVGSHDFGQGKAESRLISFAPVLARHVRLTFAGNHAKKLRYPAECCFITEVEAYAQPQ